MITVDVRGDLKKTIKFLKKMTSHSFYSDLNHYGQLGVDALSKATPVDTSLTAHSWAYRIVKNRSGPGIEWFNTNYINETSVAILIQYGHATGTGGYVIGRDYINPAMRPVFDKIADDVWKKVKS